jgi:hypothetical protein
MRFGFRFKILPGVRVTRSGVRVGPRIFGVRVGTKSSGISGGVGPFWYSHSKPYSKRRSRQVTASNSNGAGCLIALGVLVWLVILGSSPGLAIGLLVCLVVGWVVWAVAKGREGQPVIQPPPGNQPQYRQPTNGPTEWDSQPGQPKWRYVRDADGRLAGSTNPSEIPAGITREAAELFVALSLEERVRFRTKLDTLITGGEHELTFIDQDEADRFTAILQANNMLRSDGSGGWVI